MMVRAEGGVYKLRRKQGLFNYSCAQGIFVVHLLCTVKVVSRGERREMAYCGA